MRVGGSSVPGNMLIVYGSKECQEFMLPGPEMMDHKVQLKREVLGTDRSLTVLLKSDGFRWSLAKGREYAFIRQEGGEEAEVLLEDRLLLRLKSTEGGQAFLLSVVCKEIYPALKKYSLSDINRIQIGADEGCVINYHFEDYISGKHAQIYRRQDQWKICDSSRNGSWLNGTKIMEEKSLKFGDQITIFGLQIIWLGKCFALGVRFGECRTEEKVLRPLLCERTAEKQHGEASLENGPEKMYLKRAPRRAAALYTDQIEIEVMQPAVQIPKRPAYLTVGPSLTMILPLLLGYFLTAAGSGYRFYQAAGILTAAASALTGALWAAVGVKYAGKQEREERRILERKYESYLRETENFLRQKQDYNREALFQNYPSGNECCRMDGHDRRLWNRSAESMDFLKVRVGTGTIPFQAEIRVSGAVSAWEKDEMTEKPFLLREKYKMLHRVPVNISIYEKGMMGIIGGEEKRGCYGIVRNMIAQIAVSSCYTDVKMVFIHGDGPEDCRRWSSVRWLPHVWDESGQIRLKAENKSQMGEISCELSRIFRIRAETGGKNEKYPLPHYILFIDRPELLEGELLEHFVMHPKPEYGITSVLLAERYEDLPNGCEYVIQNDGRTAEIFAVCGEEKNNSLVFETVKVEELDRLARRLSGIRVDDGAVGNKIPDAAGFLEMYGACNLKQLQITRRWKTSRSAESLRIPVGIGKGGRLCFLDPHEKYHGPHGLVAGMTGSGKSELLQTLILSMAMNFSPEDVTFLIIDFKGGGMANLFRELPHMAGEITNLSGNQIQRALMSVKSENLRRQRILAENRVNHIDQYMRMYKMRQVETPLPHLFIIVDEFAELKKEEPEFMAELVSVAQVGRSLGVHLILATQKPSGTVDERIWSNSRFRICLRVQDKQDSRDMLHKPDASYITRAGRAYLQVGNDEVFEEFQSGYSGAEYIPGKDRESRSVFLIGKDGREIQISGESGQRKQKSETETQLQALIREIAGQAKKEHIPKSRILWQPVLPAHLILADLESGQTETDIKFHIRTAIMGLYDDPARQEQGILKLVFPDAGHTAVYGMAGTGKSTFLQTMLCSLVQNCSPRQLQFYVLDYSDGKLEAFSGAPHCGGVVNEADIEKADRFFHMLEQIIEERRQMRKKERGGRKRDMTVILVILDNYLGFQEKTEGKYEDKLVRLSREGAAYSVFLILSASGTGNGGIPFLIGENIHTAICLEMNDKFKYAEMLHVSRVPVLPEPGIRGRGITCVDGRILEFQTAMTDDDGNREKIEEHCAKVDAEWKEERARQIPSIPDNPVLADLKGTEEYQVQKADRRFLPLGYLAKDASVFSLDLWNIYCWIIQGREGSGKRNILKLLMHQAAEKKDARLCMIDLKNSGLSGEAKGLGAECLEDEKHLYLFFKDTVEEIRERGRKKQALIADGAGSEEIAGEMNRESQIFFFLPDLVSFIEAAGRLLEGKGSIQAYLENITGKGKCLGIYFFAAFKPEEYSRLAGNRIFQNMCSYGTGIHMGGNVGGQRLFSFPDIPYQEQGKFQNPGVGLLPSADGETKKIIIPRMKE